MLVNLITINVTNTAKGMDRVETMEEERSLIKMKRMKVSPLMILKMKLH